MQRIHYNQQVYIHIHNKDSILNPTRLILPYVESYYSVLRKLTTKMKFQSITTQPILKYPIKV